MSRGTGEVDHRALQRALFRVQMDAALAARVHAGDARARAALGLGALERELLLAVDPDALRADPGDRRKRQLLGNLASEYPATALVAPDGLLEAFLGSEAFHGAVARDGRLALAFGAFAAACAEERGLAALAAVVALERAMAALRRRGKAEEPKENPPGGGVLHLSPRAALVRLPEGTLSFAAALAEAAERGHPPPAPALGNEPETVLLLARLPASRHALPDVEPERLEPAVTRLLERAEHGLDPHGRAALATDLGATLEDLDAFAATLVAEGVLVLR